MVHQITLDNRFPIGVLEYRLTENLGGLEGRGSGQSNFHRIKILDHAAVFALIVSLIPVEKFGVSHLFIQEVTPVGLIYND